MDRPASGPCSAIAFSEGWGGKNQLNGIFLLRAGLDPYRQNLSAMVAAKINLQLINIFASNRFAMDKYQSKLDLSHFGYLLLISG